MITELFLNSCFILTLNKNTLIKKNKALFRDIYNIISFYEKKEKTNIPISIKNKLECLQSICKLKLEDKLSETIVDSILTGAKHRNMEDFLTSIINENYEDAIIYDGISQVRTRKKLISLLSNYAELNKFLETVKAGSFDTADNIVSDYEKFVKSMYSDLMESSRAVEVEASSSLDIMNDDYNKVVELIKKKYDKGNTIATGYDVLDYKVFKGGFEKSRLYIFAGGSGGGKSTLMLNFIVNDLLTKKTSYEIQEDDGKPKVHLVITLENLVDESLMRMYQCMYEKTDIQFLREINSENVSDPPGYVKNQVINKIVKDNTTVLFKYYPKFSISPTDIMMIMDDVKSIYGPNSIKSLYVDYLDLLKLDTIAYDQYRLELSHITSNLKDIAVQYSIPVITASQLTRDVYRGNLESKDLNMAMMSEGIKKVEHADCIIIMSKDKHQDIVHMNIGKNRNGIANLSLDFKVDFSMFKFLNGYMVVNKSKTDEEIVNDSDTTIFSGLNVNDMQALDKIKPEEKITMF
jgi:replicative DNA helicase